MSKIHFAARVAQRFLEKRAQNPLLEEHLAEFVDAEMEADEEASISRPTPMAAEPIAVAPPGWENTVKKMKKHKDEIDNPWALAWHMKNKGDTPGGKEASNSPHELHEMEEILKEHGYNPHDAKKLQDEGMGAFELEHRIKSTKPGAMGSLEYTHGLKKK